MLYSYVVAIDSEPTKVTATATLSSKFQISIPKAVREQQHWQAGQEFVFIPKGKGVLVMPVPERKQLAGIARGANAGGYRDRLDRA
ncbi:MAG: AbrB/MazE/SpoVT family DNA-binding domain-containing protein [Proteobacteria bacterium]|nr:AbrB/MazE/SpoVT family DNA-binding domain-containing protein [Pseudomonadota bacterium]